VLCSASSPQPAGTDRTGPWSNDDPIAPWFDCCGRPPRRCVDVIASADCSTNIGDVFVALLLTEPASQQETH
jgi:hypothetical protein